MGKSFYSAVFILAVVFSSSFVRGAEEFTVRDIRLEGLQRISAGTVFTYLPIQVGDRMDQKKGQAAIRALFKTGFFQDIRLEREGDVLVVFLRERPAVAEIDISGNTLIETDLMRDSLRQLGLAEGRVFDRAVLERIETELKRQYFSQGRYSVKVKTTVTPLERNRVRISIDIVEGWIARIRQINIVGNKAFNEEDLLDRFELGIPGTFSFFSSADQYSKQKLSGDIEALKSYYQDRGYLNFAIESTQVSISPDKKDIYITININEGDRYTISDVVLSGEMVVPEKELRSLIELKAGDVFSRKAATETATKLSQRLGDDGYAFANINTIPEVDEETKSVKLTLFVDPGKRVTVRRVEVVGNHITHDEVIRREIRQMEGGWLSGKAVRLSRERLERLGFFESVNVETPSVPGSDDQVDVVFSVVEKPSGNIIASIGYSDTQGIVFSLSVNQNNFLGRGSKLSLTFDNSDVTKDYSFSYNNPYYTLDGISRGFGLFVKETDAGEADVSDYTSNEMGGHLSYGIPVNETDRLGIRMEASNISLEETGSTPTHITDFFASNGKEFNTLSLITSWSRDSRNRAYFATRGTSARAALEITTGDLEYYKISYDHRWYFPLTKNVTLALKGYLGYGNGFGDTTELPFFENFYAGGVRSVRGFDGNSLGPLDSNQNPRGGNSKVLASAELVFPMPWLDDSSSVRMSTFLDAGNVSLDNFQTEELRASAGIALNWFSPLGPLIFSWAQPLNEKPGDDVEQFQFSLGFAF
ncbi:MAG: outer membrane protein assembly factor BamA [Gammaproteobacteria bacterium]